MTIVEKAVLQTHYDSNQLETLNLVVDGVNGKSGADGKGGARGGVGSAGRHGAQGVDGRHGTDAGNLEVTIIPDLSKNAFRISALGNTVFFPIGDPNRNMFLSAKGGKGGHGGAGGSGGQGGTGTRGRDATRSSYGTSGGRGGAGGLGGNGGKGANGGNGGHVVVRVNQEDTDTLMYMNVPNVKGGKRGKGGKGGACGRGGPGGQGGSSYSWQTSYTTYVSGGNGTMVPITHYQSHTNPGGSRGAQGAAGRSGNRGGDGNAGKDGLFEIIVNDSGKVHTYHDLYRLSISAVTLKDQNDDDILEPGETIECWLKVKNIGGMPTPPNYNVTFSSQSKGWVQYDPKDSNTLVLSESLKPGEEYTFAKPLILNVSYPKEITHPVSLDVSTNIKYHAIMGRVNIPFQSVEKQYTEIRVQYPVQITSHIGVKAITIQEAAPFAFAIRNISSKPLTQDDSRAIHTLIKGVSNRYFKEKDFLYYDETGELCHSKTGIFQPFDKLEPGQVQVISGLVQFSPKCGDQLNRSVGVSSLLSLQQLGPYSDKGAMPIDFRLSELQLTEGYLPPSDDYEPDVLLVTDSSISRQMIDKWRGLLDAIGLNNASIWNMTLYGGLNLHQELQHGRSLTQDFAEKTIVIFHTDESSDLWSMSDLFLAARDNDINTYIVGPKHVSFKPSLIPVDGVTPVAHRSRKRLIRSLVEEDDDRASNEYDTVEITKKYRFGRTPKEKHLIAKAKEVNEALSEAIPDRCFVVAYDYQLQEVGDKYSLGNIVVHSSLKKSEASIASLFSPLDEVDARKEQHQYSLLKLLNFDQKIELISKLHSGECGPILGQAILSDISDEQKAYREEKWKGSMSTDDIKEGLDKLQLLTSYEAGDGEEEYVMNLLFQTKYLGDRLCSRKDKLIPGRRGKIVRDRTNKLVSRAFDRIKDVIDDDTISQCKSSVKDKLRSFDSIEDLLQSFCDPMDIHKHGVLMQDNSKDITDKVMPLSQINEVSEKYHPIEVAEGRFIFESKEQRQKAVQQAKEHILKVGLK